MVLTTPPHKKFLAIKPHIQICEVAEVLQGL